MTTIEHYVRPVTANALTLAWADRDSQYARRKTAMSRETIDAIRAARQREVEFLPPIDRAWAWGQAAKWWPPEHGQGGR